MTAEASREERALNVRVGLEVHVPLATRAKLFCRCPADAPGEANAAVCPTCTGQPGARPQGVNERALSLAARVGRVLGCTPAAACRFQRKHYVYPDLPNNYQRTTTPLAEDGTFWDVGILEVHVEEDPGAYDPKAGTVDLNRSGTPLVEIVTAPELASPDDVATWLRVLRVALVRAGCVRAGAELKADVNVSIRGGDRVEVKNVVGGRNAMRAAAHELERQEGLYRQGKAIASETRHFDETTGTTRSSRDKESVGDYRYMPDPDLLPLDVAGAFEAAGDVEDLPGRVRELEDTLGLELGEALALLEDPALEDLFGKLKVEVPEELAVDIALRRLRSELDYRDTTLADAPAEPSVVLDLGKAWGAERITKQVFTRLLRAALDGEDVADRLAEELAAELDLAPIVAAVVEENPGPVEDYRGGKEGALNFLVGQVMARTKGRADPAEARARLSEALEA